MAGMSIGILMSEEGAKGAIMGLAQPTKEDRAGGNEATNSCSRRLCVGSEIPWIQMAECKFRCDHLLMRHLISQYSDPDSAAAQAI